MPSPLVRRLSLVALLCAAAIVPLPAAAQFGSLLKKAAEKAVDKATGAEDRVSDRVQGAELTDDQINKLFKGLALVASRLEERDKLATRQQAISDQVAQLGEKHGAEIEANRSAREHWRSCFGDQWEKLQEKRQGELQARMMAGVNTAGAQQLIKAQLATSTEMQNALAAGDTAGYRKAEAKLVTLQMQLLGIDPKKDSAIARVPCGAEPAHLAVAITVDTLTERSNKLGEQMRELERSAQAQGSVAAGLNGTDFALAREKVLTFSSTGNGGKLLTAAELERLRARRAEIEKLKRAL